MSTVKKSPIKEKEYNVVVTDKARNYVDDAFFIKKEEKAAAFLRKHPLPEHLKK